MTALRLLLAFAFTTIAAPAWAQNLTNGHDLYMGICRACHGFPPGGGPDRARGDPFVIQNAINGRVPAMGFLRGILSADDVRDIAAWLLNPVASTPPPPTPPVPAHDFTDLWWNPAESGWGLNLIQHASDVVFGVMYTYDLDGRASWLVLPAGQWSNVLTYTGALYRVSGPHFNRNFDPALVKVAPVGTATLQFADRDSGTFTFSVDGVTVTKTITRQPF